VFGRKDFQQLHVIRRMVEDLSMPIEIVGEETARADSGLALSSRNGYLTDSELAAAPALYQQLTQIRDQVQAGSNEFAVLQVKASEALEEAGFRRDYVHIVNRNTLQPATSNDTQLVILAAAYLGHARLIDNLEFDR
jgi:pantoate--beta-alanine ligase